MNDDCKFDDYLFAHNLVDDITKRLAGQYDAFIFYQFARFGYPNNKVLELIHRKRISAIRSDQGSTTVFIVDGKPLFEIAKICKCDMDTNKYVEELICSDIAEGTNNE